MPGWLRTALGWTVSGVSDVWNKVLSLLRSVLAQVNSDIDSLWNDVTSLYNGIVKFTDAVESWAVSQFQSVLAWAAHAINDVSTWAYNELASLGRDVNSIITWTSNLISAVEHYAASLVDAAYQWVIKNVYDPIANAINTLTSWINQYGYTAYYLATHPEALAQLVGKWIYDSYLDLLRDYAAPIGSWMLHQMLRAGTSLGPILEDIIAAIVD